VTTVRARVLFIAILGMAAFGQTVAEQIGDRIDRVYRFPADQSEQTVTDNLIMLRVATGVKASPYEAAFRSVTLHGSPEEMALAEWLLEEVSRPVAATRNPADRQFHMAHGDYPEVRVLHWVTGSSLESINYILSSIRYAGDVSHNVTACPQSRALILRGSADQVALAEWLFRQLDGIEGIEASQLESRPEAKYEYAPALRGETATRVVFMPSTITQQGQNDLITSVRTTCDVTRIMGFGTKAIVMRSAPARIAAAEWVIQKLNRPDAGTTMQQPEPFARGEEQPWRDVEQVMVHYLYTKSSESKVQLVAGLRWTGGGNRVYATSTPSAIALAGTVEEVDFSNWLLNELDRPDGDQLQPQSRHNTEPYPYREPASPVKVAGEPTVVRVFYPARREPERLNQLLIKLRVTGTAERIFAYTPTGAIVVRCKPDQMEAVERLVAAQDEL
jgi:type II secretory pathway component GspD/PulD (secretin)